MFDIQVKRFHEYKRQHLNLLHVVSLYKRLKDNPNLHVAPRTVIFGGKAAPGYFLAKLMIRLITAVADLISRDPGDARQVAGRLLSELQRQECAGDLPWRRSVRADFACRQGSIGTGNMKFQMNGALTIGTLDGANVEMREEVGEENFFLFGMTTPEVRNSSAGVTGHAATTTPTRTCAK
jgi:starch phosphorylase